MKKKIFFTLLATLILLPAFALPAKSFAAPSSPNAVGIQDWSVPPAGSSSQNTNNQTPSADTSATICEKIFTGNSQNLFKDVICNLIQVIAVSTSQFSTEMTCTIQKVGNASNYFHDINFTYGDVGNQMHCLGSGGASGESQSAIPGTPGTATANTGLIFGIKPDSATGGNSRGTGFYANERSNLTEQLDPAGSSAAQTAFTITKWLVALAGIIGLIIFAFANILHLELNTYAFKKALPAIIIAIIGGWVSITIIILLVRFVDFTYRLDIFSPYQTLYPMNNIFGGPFTQNFTDTIDTATGLATTTGMNNSVSLIYDVGGKILGLGTDSVSFFSGLLGAIFLLIPALEVFIFEYVLALRPFVVGILAAVGPLAFACLILPQTQIIFRKWWTYLLLAIFYAPLVNFVFYFLNLFTENANTDNNVAFMSLWFIKIVVIGLLIRFPFAFESDLKKITAKLADTKFGAALGLKKFGAGASGEGSASAPTAKSNSAKSDLAPDKSKQIQNLARTKTYPPNATPGVTSGGRGAKMALPEVKITNLSKILKEASQTNLNRPPELLLRSINDLAPKTMKAVVDKSDLALWRDTRLIEQLKNQNGQVLDEQGAAIRSDAVRKVLRVAQEFTGGKLSNPEAIRALAQKGLLSSLPEPVISQSIREGFSSFLVASVIAEAICGKSVPVLFFKALEIFSVTPLVIRVFSCSIVWDISVMALPVKSRFCMA